MSSGIIAQIDTGLRRYYEQKAAPYISEHSLATDALIVDGYIRKAESILNNHKLIPLEIIAICYNFYKNDVGKFQQWADENGYDTEDIIEEFQLEPKEMAFIDFDDDFPTNWTGDRKITEIFTVLYQCFKEPAAFFPSPDLSFFENIPGFWNTSPPQRYDDDAFEWSLERSRGNQWISIDYDFGSIPTETENVVNNAWILSSEAIEQSKRVEIARNERSTNNKTFAAKELKIFHSLIGWESIPTETETENFETMRGYYHQMAEQSKRVEIVRNEWWTNNKRFAAKELISGAYMKSHRTSIRRQYKRKKFWYHNKIAKLSKNYRINNKYQYNRW